jgi:hypothetical protein
MTVFRAAFSAASRQFIGSGLALALGLFLAGCDNSPPPSQGKAAASPPPAAASSVADQAAAACPSPDFSVFLRAFANDVRIQKAFVADPLQHDFIDANADPEPKPVTEMLAARDLQFPLIVEKDGLKAQAPVVNGDQASVKLLKEDTSYQITYHFQQTGGCWRLVRIQNDSI